MTIADTPDQIRLFQLISAKHAIGLEAKGMRHSRLRGGARKLWAIHYCMNPRAKHADVIARIQEEIDDLSQRVNQMRLPL
jgi:hypothetical protein